MIKINEIFHSIQGESSRAGLRTVFIRTSGCHLRCHYCDTQYAYTEGKKLSLEEILDQVQGYHCENVCVTGGEPLLQKQVPELVSRLLDQGYQVSIETSGDLDATGLDSRARKIIDIKTPDSGAHKTFLKKNLELDPVNTELKFVICSENDFVWAESYAKEHNLFGRFSVLYSPSFGEVSENWLAHKILNEKSPARLHLQLHKYIWSPDQRGV